MDVDSSRNYTTSSFQALGRKKQPIQKGIQSFRIMA